MGVLPLAYVFTATYAGFSFGIRANGVTSLICVIPLPESIACHRNSHSRLDAMQTGGRYAGLSMISEGSARYRVWIQHAT